MVSPYEQIPRLPTRDPHSHKGTCGTVLLAAGSTGMLGAAILAARGALRGGAGLVRAWVPEVQRNPLTIAVPCATTLSRGEGGPGGGGMGGVDVRAALSGCDAVVVGPGLGNDAAGLVPELLHAADMPVVLDADGLNAVAPLTVVLPGAAEGLPRILTPHPGEAARLLGCGSGDVQGGRQDAAVALAERSGGIAVLKGHGTLVTDGERLFTNGTGNPGMATGGSGDVLAGLIGALLAQGMDPFEAAVFGVHVHGLAGDLVAERIGEVGLTAEDLPLAIAEVLAR